MFCQRSPWARHRRHFPPAPSSVRPSPFESFFPTTQSPCPVLNEHLFPSLDSVNPAPEAVVHPIELPQKVACLVPEGSLHSLTRRAFSLWSTGKIFCAPPSVCQIASFLLSPVPADWFFFSTSTLLDQDLQPTVPCLSVNISSGFSSGSPSLIRKAVSLLSSP